MSTENPKRRKFRLEITEKTGRRHTRHVRAVDMLDAKEQLKVITSVLCPGVAFSAVVTEKGKA